MGQVQPPSGFPATRGPGRSRGGRPVPSLVWSLSLGTLLCPSSVPGHTDMCKQAVSFPQTVGDPDTNPPTSSLGHLQGTGRGWWSPGSWRSVALAPAQADVESGLPGAGSRLLVMERPVGPPGPAGGPRGAVIRAGDAQLTYPWIEGHRKARAANRSSPCLTAPSPPSAPSGRAGHPRFMGPLGGSQAGLTRVCAAHRPPCPGVRLASSL